MKLTRVTSPKLHSQAPLPARAILRYVANRSQPHDEVTAHKHVRRRSPPIPFGVGRTSPAHAALAMMVWLVSGVGFLFAACRHAPPLAPSAKRSAVQLLIQAGPTTNPGDDGQPWPTTLTLYQLRGDPDAREREPIDALAVLTRGDAAFGDLLVDKREFTAFPDTRARVVLPLGPETTHLVAVAHFREPLGDAALLRYPVPSTPDPCLYLGLERSELDGGEFPPPGFDPAAFATTCPPPAALTPPVPEASPTAAPKPPVPKASPTAAPVPTTLPRSQP